jgi:hypothetical protein
MGYILPKKMLPDEFKVNRSNQLNLNGESWISLSQKTLYDDFYGDINPSSFECHVHNHMCAVIDSNIEDKKIVNHILYDYYGSRYINDLIDDNSEERYSTFMDEVQTRKPVSVTSFLAIGYPLKYYQSCKKDSKEIKKELEYIKEILEIKSLNLPVIDSSYYDFADNKENIEKNTILILHK